MKLQRIKTTETAEKLAIMSFVCSKGAGSVSYVRDRLESYNAPSFFSKSPHPYLGLPPQWIRMFSGAWFLGISTTCLLVGC